MNTVLVDGASQLVILDTPGIATGVIVIFRSSSVRIFSVFFRSGHLAKAHKLAKSLVVDPELSLKHADMILVVVDASDRYHGSRISPRVLHLLCRYSHLISVLVLNKVDLIKNKSTLLETVNILTKGVVGGKRIRRKVSYLVDEPEDARDDVRSGKPVPASPTTLSATHTETEEWNYTNKIK
ncbi:unnamed protein product [Soboliphyme baturini]|uniref:G domain-containing protein n=1 Tax=Soboliphyme baturini TaxID=241478 RepID=A0A183JB30_9BILA|nr:unnamed protein product [Soboliphyme baturini]